MVLASLAGDSLALGAHWIYDTDLLSKEIGRVEQLLSPLPHSYHATRRRGEFTHYGDQALVLCENIARNKAFILQGFSRDWQHLFSSYTGYMDQATEQTLKNFAAGAPPEKSGSDSADLGGAARIAPLVYCYRNDLEKLIFFTRQQTVMTHTAPSAVAAADFLARLSFAVLHDTPPAEAVRNTLEQGVSDINLSVKLREALESGEENSCEVIARLGQRCSAEEALPGAVHLIIKYPGDLQTALIENTMAGGDSAARGLAVGMVLGAHLGMKHIPGDWLNALRQYDHITNILRNIP